VLDRSAIARSLKPRLIPLSSLSGVDAEISSFPTTDTGLARPLISQSNVDLHSSYASLTQSLPDIRRLLDTALSHCIASPKAKDLQTLVEGAEKWQNEVLSLQPPATSAAEPASVKPASLRRVEALLAEGERLPFELTPELNILREKLSQAKQWLDKLKKTMALPKGGKRLPSQRSAAQGGGTSTNETKSDSFERPALSDIKMMVAESDFLGERDRDEFESTRGAVSNRELSKVASIVEIAEDWLLRVRDALSAATSSRLNKRRHTKAGPGGDENAMITDSAEMNTSPNDKQDDQDGHESRDESDGDDNDALDELRELLRESDEMPVFMEEAAMLRCQLQALEWANKAASILPASLLVYPDPGPNECRIQLGKHDENENDSGDRPTLRLVEVQRLAKEIRKIRSSVSTSDTSHDDSRGGLQRGMTKPLPEENLCNRIVDGAEIWIAKVKLILQANGKEVVKGTPLAVVRELLKEGRRIPLNLEYEMRPLRSAVESVTEWLRSSASTLLRLGICSEELVSVAPEHSASDSPHAHIDEAESRVVTFEELFHCAKSASSLCVTFPESDSVTEKFHNVNEWISTVTSKCQPKDSRLSRAVNWSNYGPKRSGGSSSSSSSESHQLELISGPRRKSKMDAQQLEGSEVSPVKSGENENENEYCALAHEDKDALIDKERKDESPGTQSHSAREVLQRLYVIGKSLGVDVDFELELIEKTLAAISIWGSSALESLISADESELTPVVNKYVSLAVSEPHHLPFSCFCIEGDDVSETAHLRDFSDGDNASGGQSVDNIKSSPTERAEESTLWHGVSEFNSKLQRILGDARDLGIGMDTMLSLELSVPDSCTEQEQDKDQELRKQTITYIRLQLCAAAIRWIVVARKSLLFPKRCDDIDDGHICGSGSGGGGGESGGSKSKRTSKKAKITASDTDAVAQRSRQSRKVGKNADTELSHDNGSGKGVEHNIDVETEVVGQSVRDGTSSSVNFAAPLDWGDCPRLVTIFTSDYSLLHFPSPHISLCLFAVTIILVWPAVRSLTL
jgi:PLU-1-like protein